MFITDDVHRQFAEFFEDKQIWPYAYLLSKKLSEGHICIDVFDPAIFEGTTPYTHIIPIDLVLKQSKLISLSSDAIVTPFILHHQNLYFHRYFQYETQCIEKIKQMIDDEKPLIAHRKKQLLALQSLVHQLQASYPLANLKEEECVDWQLIAVLQTLLTNFSIITGGPGTGKTTTLAKLLILLFEIHPQLNIALAAPTGKAAVRMYESLKNTALTMSASTKEKIDALQPSTLHNLLGFQKDTVAFKYNADKPLPFEWVVVDEASMIDLPMFAKLLSALKPSTRLVLLGDRNQLASVEAGSILGDLCQILPMINRFDSDITSFYNQFFIADQRTITSRFVSAAHSFLNHHIIELMYSHRFNSLGAIGVISKAVLLSDDTLLHEYITTSSREVSFDTDFSSDSIDEIIQAYAAYVVEKDIALALKKLNQQRLLVAVREGAYGLYAYNKRIEELLWEKGLLKPDIEFYNNRPILITKNRYDLGLFNGDVGIVRADEDGVLKVWFETESGALKSVLPAYLSDCETVFAMTIHKSQGSEFDLVMVVLPKGSDWPLLTRELLYTGITRAKKRLLVLGEEATLFYTIQKQVQRISGISKRITQLDKEGTSL